MPKPTLTEQREAVEALINFALGGEEVASLVEAKQAVLTLGWLERKAELVKEIDRLDREAPAIATLLKEFQNAKILEVR